MVTATREAGAHKALEALTARFTADVIDVPGGKGRVRLKVKGEGAWDVTLRHGEMDLHPANESREPDAVLEADAATWGRIGTDIRGGMDAFGEGKLSVRGNLHLGVGFLAATSEDRPGRLRFGSVSTSAGNLSLLEAGEGHPVVCIHGLGGTKGSFLTTVSDLADHHRVVALDLPGFGDSAKPMGAAYNAAYFANVVVEALDTLGIERAHLAGNSMGGRVAIEMGLDHASRVDKIVLLSPALAWLKKSRAFLNALKVIRPELGIIQPAPRPIVNAIVRRLVPGANDGWTAAGVDEFLRAYLTPRGRAAFYASARNIYLDEPNGTNGFWSRLRELSPESMFVWGKHDQLVPIAFMKHVERTLPAARHLELNCGHVPQVERPRETHAAMLDFFGSA